MPLVGEHGADAQEPVAGGRAVRFLAAVHTGSGDVHTFRGQPTALEQPSSRPRAGRDDGAGIHEDGALGVRVDGDAAERHVHQDHLPQSRGLRHQDAPAGGRDQAVEQDEPAIRHAADRAPQPGQCRRVGPGPRAGHDKFPHVPAARRQLAAEPTVVAVPAARSGVVIDAVGDDDVDGRHGSATEI